jgi:hypothetical protein
MAASCARVVPKPMPGSTAMRVGGDAELFDARGEPGGDGFGWAGRLGEHMGDAVHQNDRKVAGAGKSAMPGRVKAATSLRIAAPWSKAARATAALLVSTEIGNAQLVGEAVEDREQAAEFFCLGRAHGRGGWIPRRCRADARRRLRASTPAPRQRRDRQTGRHPKTSRG